MTYSYVWDSTREVDIFGLELCPTQGIGDVKSLVKDDKGLIKAEEDMGKNQRVQMESNNLIKEFLSGNTNPGIGSKNLFKDVAYLRGRNGASIFYRMRDGIMEILGKSSKVNEQKVIDIIKKLYG